jgi:hypothetical protein
MSPPSDKIERRGRQLAVFLIVMMAIGAASQWGRGFQIARATSPPGPMDAAEIVVAEAFGGWPTDARCLLVTDILPWQLAYDAAPRLLFRFTGEKKNVLEFVRERELACVAVMLPGVETTVAPVERFQ